MNEQQKLDALHFSYGGPFLLWKCQHTWLGTVMFARWGCLWCCARYGNRP